MPNYGPYGYGSYPYMNQQSNYQGGVAPNFYPTGQPQPSIMPNQYQPIPEINQYTYVNGIEGAKAYQVPPGRTMLLIDNEHPIISMKTTNPNGQSSLKYFHITEMDENQVKSLISGQSNINNQQVQNYVLKEDFEALSRRYDELSKRIDKLNGKLNKELNNNA